MRYLLILLALLVGCGEPPESERGDRAKSWINAGGDGTPHRYSRTKGGTEFLTIGHHDFGQYYLLIRYADEERFTIHYDGEALKAAESAGMTIEAIK